MRHENFEELIELVREQHGTVPVDAGVFGTDYLCPRCPSGDRHPDTPCPAVRLADTAARVEQALERLPSTYHIEIVSPMLGQATWAVFSEAAHHREGPEAASRTGALLAWFDEVRGPAGESAA